MNDGILTKRQLIGIIFSAVLTFTTVIYTVINLVMFFQLKESNDLLRKEQVLTLRPYVNLVATPTNYIEGGTAEEKWKILSIIVNQGQLPAKDVVIYSWIDYHDSLVVNKKPSRLNKYSLSPNGGTTTTNIIITKKEVLNYLEVYKYCFLHSIIWYEDLKGGTYFSKYTYKLDYEEGKHLSWDPTFVEIR